MNKKQKLVARKHRKNKERIKERSKEYYLENKEKKKEYNKEYYLLTLKKKWEKNESN